MSMSMSLGNIPDLYFLAEVTIQILQAFVTTKKKYLSVSQHESSGNIENGTESISTKSIKIC